MKPSNTAALPCVLFTLGKNTYGIDSGLVKSIERLDEVTEMMGAEASVRGGLLYQNHFIHLIDMRKRFGLKRQIDEFEAALQTEQRIKDHEHWVAELEKSVRERTEFKLAEDPRLCAFGKWYYSFSTNNTTLKYKLREMEEPHAKIHQSAAEVKKLMRENKQEKALAVIAEMKETHYKKTLEILSSLRETVENSLREVYIVIETTQGMKGLIVDSIVGVEAVDRTHGSAEFISRKPYLDFLGQRKNDPTIVIVLNNLI